MRRDLIFKVHETCRDKKYPGVADLFAFNETIDAGIGSAYTSVTMDLLEDLDTELATRVMAGETIRCRLEIVTD